MSFWSDYKAGCITESEYTALCNREAWEEKAREEAEWAAYVNSDDDYYGEEDIEDDEFDEY